MAYCVLQVQTTAHGAPTVCGVQADNVVQRDGMLQVQCDNRVVYSAPLDKVIAHALVPDRAAALVTMRDWQGALAHKGRLGDEHTGIRPAAGRGHQVGQMVESVQIALGDRHVEDKG